MESEIEDHQYLDRKIDKLSLCSTAWSPTHMLDTFKFHADKLHFQQHFKD